MMYRAIKKFRDLQDNHIYKVGDVFPYDKRRITKKRIEELTSRENKLGMPLIRKEE